MKTALLAVCLACGLAVAGISEGVHGEANPNTGMDGIDADGNLSVTTPAGWTDGLLGVLLLFLDSGDGSTPTGWTDIAANALGLIAAGMVLRWMR